MNSKQIKSTVQVLITCILLLIVVGCNSVDVEPTVAITPTADILLAAVDLRPDSSIKPLNEGLTPAQEVAQAIALNDEQTQLGTVAADGESRLRTEVFAIYPALPSDITQNSERCRVTTCYRVDIYNFANNFTYVAMVDVEGGNFVDLSLLRNATPDLPPHLTDLAIKIATTSEEVIAQLGFNPAPDDPTMPNIKTALNDTICERSQHLCVAPTFIVDTRALWAIVDLVDERVVATRWTELGDVTAGLPTEELIASEDVFAEYCEKSHTETRNGWEFEYMLTSTDGLRIAAVQFNGTKRFRSIKLVDYHVSYSEREGFGYSDAIGCPMFSSAAVVALDAPQFEPFEDGFALTQDYVHPQWPEVCNYRYQQRYEFYDDGRLRVMAANLGRGCGNDATYRFLYRIDPVGAMSVSAWDGSAWQAWDEEQWMLDDGTLGDDTPLLRLENDAGGGYLLEPNRGQFDDDSRGDNALVYAVQHKADEGDADMVTLGVCCNINYEQGPETFINEESLQSEDVVIWYVPQVENDDTPGNEYCWVERVVEDGLYTETVWPCWAGAMLVPIE